MRLPLDMEYLFYYRTERKGCTISVEYAESEISGVSAVSGMF
jgi:hypothetical protein